MDEVVVKIQSEDDIYIALSRIRHLIAGVFPETDQQAVFVTVLELCRNVINHAGGSGTIICGWVNESIRIEVRDRGPGIADLDQILSGQYVSPTGLGLGLLGSKRLMDELNIETSERGTTVVAVKRAYHRNYP